MILVFNADLYELEVQFVYGLVDTFFIAYILLLVLLVIV